MAEEKNGQNSQIENGASGDGQQTISSGQEPKLHWYSKISDTPMWGVFLLAVLAVGGSAVWAYFNLGNKSNPFALSGTAVLEQTENAGTASSAPSDYSNLQSDSVIPIQYSDSPSTSSKSPMQVDASSWPVYQNKEFGFEIKYPNNDSSISVNANTDPQGSRVVFPENFFSVIVAQQYNGDLANYKYLGHASSGVTADGFVHYKFESSGVMTDAYAKNSSGKLYIIEFLGSAEPVAEAVLSSFQSIE